MVEIPYRRQQMETKPLRHAVLIGEYELTIDGKNRLLVPSEIRRSLDVDRDGEAFYLVVGQNRKPWMYTQKYYEEMVYQTPTDLMPTEDSLAFDQLHFAMAGRLEWDKQGRVLIPEKTLKRTGLNREITMIGVRNHLELWDRSEWDRKREELVERGAEIAAKAKQARST